MRTKQASTDEVHGLDGLYLSWRAYSWSTISQRRSIGWRGVRCPIATERTNPTTAVERSSPIVAKHGTLPTTDTATAHTPAQICP